MSRPRLSSIASPNSVLTVLYQKLARRRGDEENTLCAARWFEYKVHWRVFLNQATRRNLDESTLVPTGISPWVYNLYMDPREQSSQGHSRFEWGIPQVMRRAARHLATFERYPRKDIGLRQ